MAHSQGWQHGACCRWETSVPLQMGLLQHCLGVVIRWLISLRAIYPKEQSRNYPTPFVTQSGSHTLSLLHQMLNTETALIQCGKRLQEGSHIEKKGSYQEERIFGAHLGGWRPCCSFPCICGGLKNGPPKIADSHSETSVILHGKRTFADATKLRILK